MQKKVFDLLEFNKILDRLSEYALSNSVKEKIKTLRPYMNKAEVIKNIAQTTQAKIIMEKAGAPPVDSSTMLEKVLCLLGKDAMLLPEQLAVISVFITACNRMKKYLKKAEITDTEVSLYGNTLNDLSELKDEINRCISGSMVDDNASSELANIRKRIAREKDRIKLKLEAILKSHTNAFSEHFVVIRNGHFALPVKKEYKKHINGTIIDSSKSGGTYYIEPSAIGKIQDTLALLEVEEENEVRKILYTLTALVEDYLQLIKLNIEAMETLDFLFAKGKLSIAMQAVPAQITANRKIMIKCGRHPLIDNEVVVPINFQIGNEVKGKGIINRIVITGPNTGGKTVVLKTVGLLSVMAQSGLHVPAEEAVFCINNTVLCDIGDGQSITENLSTFSSHMINIIDILNTADEQSLVLLDELGSGTDPAEGMGLATAILEELAKKGCLLLATTHYPEIKDFASKTNGFINARMAFDRQQLVPLYKLEIGESGESCALYIAKRLGLPKDMIDRAYTIAYSGHKVTTSDAYDKANDFENIPLQKRKSSNKKKQPKAIAFNVGDSVRVYPQKLIGIVYKAANEEGEIGVQVKGEKKLVNHKRLKLHVAASELYPENYDFSIVFDSVENRKARHQMSKKHNPHLSIPIKEGDDIDE